MASESAVPLKWERQEEGKRKFETLVSMLDGDLTWKKGREREDSTYEQTSTIHSRSHPDHGTCRPLLSIHSPTIPAFPSSLCLASSTLSLLPQSQAMAASKDLGSPSSVDAKEERCYC
jgi:hypothetical protein